LEVDGVEGLHVWSEIGQLRRVLLHRPGDELLGLVPGTLGELLFDDIPFLRAAQAEHDAFAAVLSGEGAQVVYLEDLMAQVLEARPELREQFVHQWMVEAGIRTARYQGIVRDFLAERCPGARELVLKTMAGVSLQELHGGRAARGHGGLGRRARMGGAAPAGGEGVTGEGDACARGGELLVDLVSDASKMVCPPMPNLYFTRDPFCSLGRGVSINRMHWPVRNRETIYAEYIFTYHPDFARVRRYYDRNNTFKIEGGDVLVLSPHVLAVGISERTEPDAIEQLARAVFADSARGAGCGCDAEGVTGEGPRSAEGFDTVLAFSIPRKRAFMHLDTVFTQVDVDKFTYHPAIVGHLEVFEITPQAGFASDTFDNMSGTAGQGELRIRRMDGPLDQVLCRALGRPVELIACGGADRIAAEREQWNDGSNTLCVRPGTVVVYDRNTVTNELLAESGVRVLEVPSSELSRGRGGPRCMSMPLWRE
jgi:arginine deiminase